MSRLFLFPLFLLSAFSSLGQNQPQQRTSDKDESSTIRSLAQEVVLDMVFRDKKGKTITNIRPEEIHISEDGVEQSIKSFHLVQGNARQAPVAQPNGSQPMMPQPAMEMEKTGSLPLDPMREIRLVTLVFEGLDMEGKRFFQRAVKDILDMTPEQNLYFSIIAIDQRLHLIQPFTADHAALQKSLDRSSMWSFTQYSNQSAEVSADLKRMVSGDQPDLAGTATSGPTPAQIQNAINWKMAKMQYDMLQAAEAADHEKSARATIDALLALVQAQSALPGRKVVLYFNPQLLITETVKEQYTNLISIANRANVSFYTVDPKGLVSMSQGSTRQDWVTTWSESTAGRDQLSAATTEIRTQQMSRGAGTVTAREARAAETAEGAVRANPLEWLRDLAQQTGGVTIANTNDLSAPLKAAMEEVRTYFEASYAPRIAAYDGKFRKIAVRVDRPDVVVHTRSGYFALPRLKPGQQLFTYEMPLLNALNAASIPLDVVFHAAAERFNGRGPKIEYMVTLEIPLRGVTFAPQSDHKTAAVDAALLAVLKDPRGEIVEKFNKRFAVQIDIDKLDAYKAGNLVQTFHTELAPGTYHLEAAVMDSNSTKVGVKRSVMTVPEPSSKLSMSDIVVVRRTEPLNDNQIQHQDAFYFPGGKVVPTLTDALKGGPGNILPFYFAVYPDSAMKDAAKLTMSFYKEGKYLGAAEAPLPAAQADGRIPYIANLPADKFTPGAYEIRIGVIQGNSKVEENVAFQVQ